MKPPKHVIASLSLGAIVWSFTQSQVAGLLCFLSGVLIDVDHLIDYTIHYGLKTFNFREIYQACERLARRKEEGGVKNIYLIFHAAEIAILLWLGFVFTHNIYLLSIALGYTGHLIMDTPNSEIKPSAYFLSLRMKKGFRTKELARWN